MLIMEAVLEKEKTEAKTEEKMHGKTMK